MKTRMILLVFNCVKLTNCYLKTEEQVYFSICKIGKTMSTASSILNERGMQMEISL